MLTDEQIIQNKETFISLIESIDREGMKKESLINKLTNSDFFYAPASTRFHSNHPGGLCEHSLLVYRVLREFVNMFYGDASPFSDDTIKIVSLFHDFDKMNKYEKTVINKKVYSDAGTRYDDLGKYDWQSVPGYKQKDYKDIFTFGTHGENSVYMTGSFINLTDVEISAILNHHGIYDNPNLDTSVIFRRYPLSCLLHLADMACTFVVEVDE